MNQRHSTIQCIYSRALRLVWALVFISVSSAALAQGAVLSPALREFKTQWNRVSQGKSDRPDSPAVRALAIYPYLVAARLQRDLADQKAGSVDPRVRLFLSTHAGQPIAHRLFKDWLKSLAKRKKWKLLVANYDPEESDNSLRCEWLEARIKVGDIKGLSHDIADSYLVGHSQPKCRFVFHWWTQHGGGSTDLLMKRVRLALKSGHTDFARQLIATLPKPKAKPFLEWAKLIGDPKSALKILIEHPERSLPRKALEDGWFRLASQQPAVALQLYPRLCRAFHLQGRELRPFIRDLALGLAWNRDARAIRLFKEFTPKRSDIRTLTWRVRSALWASDWKDAKAWIAAMPETLRDQPEWQYWRARTEAATGNLKAAQVVYEKLAGTDGYYALLSAWRLSRRYVPHTTPVANIPHLQEKMAHWPAMKRAHELFEVGLSSLATREWTEALDQANPEERLQAIRLAARWGWYSEAVGTASRQGVFEDYQLLYPFPYSRLVDKASRRYDLPANWIYGLMRQESLYNPKAISPASAYGLLQLQLPTAHAVADSNGLPPPKGSGALLNPRTNVMLGSALLKGLLNREKSRLIVALAAYNAGHNAAENWLPKHPISADIWIENIPYDETRVYVKRILWHIAIFNWLRSGRAQSIWRQMANVQPERGPIVASAS